MYRQGLRALFASVLALGLGGCTFDEDELHGLPEAGVEVTVNVGDAAADGRGIVDTGTPEASRIDAGRIDAGEDAPVQIDAGAIDRQRIDGGDDAIDAPLGGLDVSIGVSPIDGPAIDVSAIDAATVDVSRTETAQRDGSGRDG